MYGIYGNSYKVGMVDPTAGSSNFSRTSLISGSSKIVFYAGSFDPTGGSSNSYTKIPEFTVLADGSLYASAAQITGSITAKSGYIGPSGNNSFKIEEMTMTSSGTKYLAIHRGLTYNSSGTYYSFTNGEFPLVLCPYGVKSASNLVSGGTSSLRWVFLAGKVSSGVVPFGITDAGGLYASAGKIGGWTIGTTGLTYGTGIGSADSFCLYPAGLTYPGAIGGSGLSSTWVMTIGSTFGVTSSGVLYATGAYISGVITASGGKIGSALSSGQLFINGSQTVAGDTSGTSVCYFQKGTATSLNLSQIRYGLGTNDFFLGNGGLIMRNPNFTLGSTSSSNSSYRGFRLSSSGFYIEGSNKSLAYAGKAL